jgi:DNA-binding NarL/FixJ family response regulator
MSPQAGWLLQSEIMPRLQHLIPRSVNGFGSEDIDELVQDATAIAAQMLHNVELAGKTVTPGNIAYYAAQHLRAGRRSTGSSVADALAVGTQLKGRTRLTSMDEPLSADEPNESLNDVLAAAGEDPGTLAARRLDWQSLLNRLTARETAIIQYLVAGRTVSEVALAFKVSRSAMQFCKRNLVRLIKEFMGADILAEIQRTPGWRDGLKVISERQGCRAARKG